MHELALQIEMVLLLGTKSVNQGTPILLIQVPISDLSSVIEIAHKAFAINS
jgi:hypothetical protein